MPPVKLLPFPIATIRHSDTFANCITELKDGTLLTGGFDKTIRRWTRDGSTVVKEYHCAEGILLSLFQLDDSRFVSATERMIYVWNMDEGSCSVSFSSQRSMSTIGLKTDRNVIVGGC